MNQLEFGTRRRPSSAWCERGFVGARFDARPIRHGPFMQELRVAVALRSEPLAIDEERRSMTRTIAAVHGQGTALMFAAAVLAPTARPM